MNEHMASRFPKISHLKINLNSIFKAVFTAFFYFDYVILSPHKNQFFNRQSDAQNSLTFNLNFLVFD